MNLTSYNVWSCGRYTNNLTGFEIRGETEGTITLSENGITLNRSTTNNTYFFIQFTVPISSEDIGKNITIKSYCKGNGIIELWCRSSDWSNITGSSISVTDTCSQVTGTAKLVEDTAYFQVRFMLLRTANSTLIINNIHASIQ